MDELIRLGLTNAAWAAALALAAAVGTRALRRRPAVAHVLWLLVLMKLVAPTLVGVEYSGISALGHDSPEQAKGLETRSIPRALDAPTSAVLSSTLPIYKVELQKAEAEVRRFEARLKRMSAEGARLKEQRRQNIVAEAAVSRVEAEIEEAEASLQEAQANRDLAQLNLASTRVTAPMDGILNYVIGHEGEFVDPETTVLAKMISQDLMYATLYVDEPVAIHLNRLKSEGKIKSEFPVMIAVRGEEGFPHRGSIDFVDVEVQPTGQVRIRALVPNPDGALAPGLPARARILLGSPYPALVVPEDAVVNDHGRRCVLVLNDQNVPEKRFVSLGLLYDGLRVIEKGLKADEWIVQSGSNYHWAGRKVQPKRITWR